MRRGVLAGEFLAQDDGDIADTPHGLAAHRVLGLRLPHRATCTSEGGAPAYFVFLPRARMFRAGSVVVTVQARAAALARAPALRHEPFQITSAHLGPEHL